jgi:hypothetical protein
MSKKYKISDEVWYRVVTIIQEAMIMGIDCVDLFRMIELTTKDDDDQNLYLTKEYKNNVEKMHEKWLQEAERIRQQNNTESNKLVN